MPPSAPGTGPSEHRSGSDEPKDQVSDNEYLHYINFKIGYTNTLLKRAVFVLTVIAALLGTLLRRLT